MVESLYLPFVDANSDEVKIVNIIGSDASFVRLDDCVVEFETSKASIEFPAPKEGYVKVLVKEGEIVVPGSLIAVLGETPEEVNEYVVKCDLRSKEKSHHLNVLAAFEYSQGALLELKRNNISVDVFTEHIKKMRNFGSQISRKDIIENIPAMREAASHFILCRKFSTHEEAIKKTMSGVWNETIPLWIHHSLAADTLLNNYAEYAKLNGLTGSLTELAIWAGVEMIRTNEVICGGFIKDSCIYRWAKPALAIAFRCENGTILLPRISPQKQHQDLLAIADQLLMLKRKVVTGSLTHKDMEGGGLVISILENKNIDGFNALLAKHMSFALAICGPIAFSGENHIAITLTYDYRYVDGHTASNLLSKYCEILKKYDSNFV